MIFRLTKLFLILLVACTGIKYTPDSSFMVAAQANSPEMLVKINGGTCKDMDQIVGLCAKRVPSDKDIGLVISKQDYSYRLQFNCSKIDNDFSKDVPGGVSFSFSIKAAQLAGQRSFTCIGEIFPSDRSMEVSAKFNIRIVVYDSRYVKREDIYLLKNKKKRSLILGKHARSSTVSINGKVKKYRKRTSIKIKKEDKIDFAYSESERMRFNYLTM